MFVDGKECDRPLTLVDLEGKKIARYDLATYECNLRHRTLSITTLFTGLSILYRKKPFFVKATCKVPMSPHPKPQR